MKKFIGYILLTLIIVSCGSESGFFRIEGRFRNFNQGELFVYSADGGIDGLDTIKVFDGRFSYEVPMERATTLMLIFPNYSEQPVFAEPGATVKVSADASHLKEMKITGTDENELLTDFRMKMSEKMPPEVIEGAKKFIEKNPKSKGAIYLLNRYFIKTQAPDYPTAFSLVETMLKADPENSLAFILKEQLESMKASLVNQTLPDFKTVDINGDTITQDTLKSRVNIITLWASWNYDSHNMQTSLRKLQKRYGDTLSLLSVCLDANDTDCRRAVRRDSMLWPTICDEQMWQTPLVREFGFAVVPANIIADDNRKIVGRNLNMKDIEKMIKDLKDKK